MHAVLKEARRRDWILSGSGGTDSCPLPRGYEESDLGPPGKQQMLVSLKPPLHLLFRDLTLRIVCLCLFFQFPSYSEKNSMH